MRFDKINLIGNFIIRGNTASAGQVLGVSGSKIDWINPVSNTGQTGPQGDTGPGVFNNIPNGEVVFGNGDSITSICTLNIDSVTNNMSINSNSANFISGGLNVGVGSNEVFFCCNTNVNSIISSFQSVICDCSNSSIINSNLSCSVCSENSVILGSTYKMFNSPNSIIMSSVNYGNLKFLENSVILSTKSLSNYYSYTSKSAIIASYRSKFCGPVLSPDNSVIISSSNGCLENNTCDSVIIGTCGSTICGKTNIGNYRNNAIIGGGGGINYSSNVVILGGVYKGTSIEYVCNKTLVRYASINNKISFNPLKSTPQNLQEGTIWYGDGQTLFIFLNNANRPISMFADL